ncbi:YbaB/EbfC family nucleoid-associated protein [Plantactinospora siamensis]|uniref:YbaB/EbfC family nucleoid-associated protein n=1 Tax=Plantactinospora siamensis TaxID=555372 RepID=UPI0035ED452A
MFPEDAELAAADRWVDDWQERIERQATQARDLAERVRGLTGTARSRDGLVEVTVSSSGALTELRLAEGIRRRPAADTAQQIMEVLGVATAQLAERVTQATAETLGADSPAGRAVIESYARRVPPSTERADDGRP